MKRSVYIDTTIPSYYVDCRFELNIHITRTITWWERERVRYDIYVSPFTIMELGEGDYPGKDKALTLVDGIPLLEPVDDINEIVKCYLSNKLMPGNDIRDALHLAFASFYKMDYLLTWNCRHLANINKQEHIRVINTQIGLSTPTICTPLELLWEGDD